MEKTEFRAFAPFHWVSSPQVRRVNLEELVKNVIFVDACLLLYFLLPSIYS